MVTQESPEALAGRAKRGDAEAFNSLVRLFHERLLNFLLRRVRDYALAEDLTQDAFVRAWERIALYDPTWRFSTWLFTIATRLSVSEARRAARRPAKQLDEHSDVQDRRPEFASTHESRVSGSLWNLAATHLRDEQHTALWLRYVEDMSIGEIAKVLRKSEVGVRVCLFRARQTLADLAQKQGLGSIADRNTDAADNQPAPIQRHDGSDQRIAPLTLASGIGAGSTILAGVRPR
jgi:RNA polymerase sigma-70 factor, ECF subfamily